MNLPISPALTVYVEILYCFALNPAGARTFMWQGDNSLDR